MCNARVLVVWGGLSVSNATPQMQPCQAILFANLGVIYLGIRKKCRSTNTRRNYAFSRSRPLDVTLDPIHG